MSLRISSLCFIVLTFSAVFSAKAQIITSIAGNGTAGYTGDGGQATLAEINNIGLTMDPSGNIYLAEYQHHCVRKIDVNGIITTFAGTGVSGFSGDGGAATAAQLMGPAGVYADNSGNIYIADQDNQRVRMVNTSGIISTIAGTGVGGYSGDGGLATAAQFWAPTGIAKDASGNIYIADFGARVVRKINTSGIISTFAGTGVSGNSGDGGPATSAEMTFPYWIAFDASDNLFISDVQANCVRKVNTSGIISTVAGTGVSGFSGDGGPATAAQLYNNGGIAINTNGDMYICDQFNNRVRKVDASGMITTIAGTGNAGFAGNNGPAVLAEVDIPTGIVLRSGYIYFTDEGNSRIRKICISGPPAVSAITGDTSVCIADTIQLSCATAGGTWSSTNNNAIVLASGKVSGLTAGTDTIKYTFTNDCGTDSVSYVITILTTQECENLGINNSTASTTGISLYPNPTSTKELFVRVSYVHNEEAEVIINNVLGSRVSELHIPTNTATQIKLDNSGIYFVQVKLGNTWYRQKVVVE